MTDDRDIIIINSHMDYAEIEARLAAQRGCLVDLKTTAIGERPFKTMRNAYALSPLLFAYGMLPPAEEINTGEEEYERHARRKVAQLNHKDRRLESRDAKAAMRDRALAKLKAKKRG